MTINSLHEVIISVPNFHLISLISVLWTLVFPPNGSRPGFQNLVDPVPGLMGKSTSFDKKKLNKCKGKNTLNHETAPFHYDCLDPDLVEI